MRSAVGVTQKSINMLKFSIKLAATATFPHPHFASHEMLAKIVGSALRPVV